MRTYFLFVLMLLLFVAGCGSKAKEDLWMSKLSEEDQKAVQAQAVCPVTGLKLGEKGPPLSITVKEQKVWICCMSCSEIFDSDPDTYLAKLKK